MNSSPPPFDPRPLNKVIGTTRTLPKRESWPETSHHFDERSIRAVQGAQAARRPLLVRGEPGIGKSQLARAIAEVLQVPFLYQVINATHECQDLLFHFDAVSRLAQAQVSNRLPDGTDWQKELAPRRFVRPGVLWWAIDWKSARAQAGLCFGGVTEPARPRGWKPGQGCVVLIDEIDKADSDLPNGLLESLGNTGFQVPVGGEGVALPEKAVPPLVIVTTNEDRELPAAFLRRCLVLHIEFPKREADQMEFLVQRGRVHDPEFLVADSIARLAAEQVIRDRSKIPRGQPMPGAAEYIDLLSILKEWHPGDPGQQEQRLLEIRDFVLKKHLDDFRS